MTLRSSTPEERAMQILRALRAAVEDRRSELKNKRDARFYFDSDVVLGAFKDTEEIAAVLDPTRDPLRYDAAMADKVVFRALWAAGFGCPASVLWPHVPELARGVNQHIDSKRDDSERLSVATRCARQLFTRERLRQLRSSLQTGTATSFEEAANTLPAAYLAAAVASLPTWSLRMELIGDRLNLDAPPEPEEIDRFISSQNEAVATLSRMLRLSRLNRYQRLLIMVGLRSVTTEKNDWRDACALLEISRQFAEDRFVRFITDTDAVISVVRAGGITFSADTSNDPLDRDVIDSSSSPFRSNMYMLLRMLVPSLAFANRRERFDLPTKAKLTLDDFQRFLDESRALIRDKAIVVVEDHNVRAPASLACAGFLRDFLAMSGFGSVWFQQNSIALPFLVEHLDNLAEFGETAEQAQSYRPATIRGMELWKAERFQQISEALRAQSRLEVQISDPSAGPDEEVVHDVLELGAARWIAILYSEVTDITSLAAAVAKDLSCMSSHADGVPLDQDVVARSSAFAAACEFVRGRPLGFMERHRRTITGASETVRLAKIVLRVLKECGRFATIPLTITQFQSDDVIWKSLSAITTARSRQCLSVMLAWRAFHWCDHFVVAKYQVDCELPTHVKRVAEAARRILDQRIAHLGVGGPDAGLRVLLGQNTVEHLLDLYADRPNVNDVEEFDFGEPHSADAWAWATVLKKSRQPNDLKELQVYIERFGGTDVEQEGYIRRHVRHSQVYLESVMRK